MPWRYSESCVHSPGSGDSKVRTKGQNRRYVFMGGLFLASDVLLDFRTLFSHFLTALYAQLSLELKS